MLAESFAEDRLLAGVSILIAEDNWHVAEAIKGIVERAGGCVIGPAASVDAALTLTAQHCCDIALVDMNLKDAMADELIEAIYETGTPVIVVTGYGALPSNSDHLAVARLQKPVDADRLIIEITRALNITWRTG